jgi:hypothetical protein
MKGSSSTVTLLANQSGDIKRIPAVSGYLIDAAKAG